MCDHILRKQALDQQRSGRFSKRNAEHECNSTRKDSLECSPNVRARMMNREDCLSHATGRVITHPADNLQLDRVAHKVLPETFGQTNVGRNKGTYTHDLEKIVH